MHWERGRLPGTLCSADCSRGAKTQVRTPRRAVLATLSHQPSLLGAKCLS